MRRVSGCAECRDAPNIDPADGNHLPEPGGSTCDRTTLAVATSTAADTDRGYRGLAVDILGASVSARPDIRCRDQRAGGRRALEKFASRVHCREPSIFRCRGVCYDNICADSGGDEHSLFYQQIAI